MTEIYEKVTDKTAVALGFFDGLHIGHTAVIERALKRGKLKSVVFTFSENTPLPKFSGAEGCRLITFEDKKRLLSEMGAEYIYAPDFMSIKNLSPEEFVHDILIEKLSAAYVVCGFDFRFAKDGKAGADELMRLCAKYGIECEVVPAVSVDGEVVSSTSIRSLIKEGGIEKANRLLGYELSFSLPVNKGRQLGRTIGFPTINQYIPKEAVMPKFGVYAGRTVIDGKIYRSITDIGVKPTVKSNGEVIMETHILDYSGDLYGKTVTVSLCRYLRGEKKFSGLSELKDQLIADSFSARQLKYHTFFTECP